MCYSATAPLAKKLKLESVEVDFDEKLYVDRSFATLEDLSTQMNARGHRVLFFTGPSGTGKTTTLQVLYLSMKRNNQDLAVKFDYIDAKYIIDIPCFEKGAYIFVDNAQCLQQIPELINRLRLGKSLCFAFSPVILNKGGDSTSQCGFRYTDLYMFRPFSEKEIDDYAMKNNSNEDVIKEMKDTRVLLPRILHQCKDSLSVKRWLHTEIISFMAKIQPRLQMESCINQLYTLFMSATMGVPLTDADKVYAYMTGMFYEDDSGVPQLVFPADTMLQHLWQQIIISYSLLKEYNKGAALEFLTCAQLKSSHNDVFCMGKKPTPVNKCLDSTSYSKGKPQFRIPAANGYTVQRSCADDLGSDKSCHLVKLCESHYGIDFLIVNNPSGSASKNLFLVQVSMTKYQQRSSPKLKEVYGKRDELDGKSIVDFYCNKTKIGEDQCFFVFASPTVPDDAMFTREELVRNKVYFLEIKC